jgi:hypothetical protein
MSASSIYLKHEITIKDLAARYGQDSRTSLTNKWLFVGIDMAPIDNLETGISVMDRNRRILRMEKLNEDGELLQFLDNLSRAENIVVALDIPKSLNIPSKWRQQQIKMHPLRLNEQPDYVIPEPVPTDRFAQRAKDFYDAVEQRGILIFGFFTAHAKMRYSLNIPFRHRSPQGCRAMQAILRQRLALKDVPTNLAPSSVLDAMIGSYTAWLLCYGKESEHFQLFRDDESRLYVDPLKRTRFLSARAR